MQRTESEQTMKILLLVNPAAGHKRGKEAAQKTLTLFRQQGVDVTCIYSEYAGHLVEIAAREVTGNWDGIAALGGDGTLFEVINGMMRGNSDLPIPLGVLPVGTGNSFSRDLHAHTLENAVQAISSGKTRKIDLGRCDYQGGTFYFINILGFGFVADVAQKASLYKKLGSLSYVIGVFIITKNLQSYSLDFEIDGKAYQRENVFVEISNSTKTGGDMIMAPAAKIDDGLLDVIVLNKISRFGILSTLPKIFKGAHVQIPQIETFQGRTMRFVPAVDKVLTPDGEITGRTPVSVSVIPGKIKVFDSL